MTDSFWRGRRVFVTGCAGFVGSWVTRALLQCGACVIGLVRDTVAQSLFFSQNYDRQVNVVYGHLEDYGLIERTLNEYNVECVFHLAAQPLVGVANREPMATLDTNIRGTWHVLEAGRRVGCVKALILASSDKSYGSNDRLPYTEDMPLRGEHPYDVSKSCVDLLARMYYLTYGLPVCTIRWGNTFGGGDLNFNRLVPDVIRSCIFDRPPVIRSDGTFIRDYLYVEDAANIYLTLGQKMLCDGLKGEAFNAAYQAKHSVLQLTEKIQAIMGKSHLRPQILNIATGEIREQFLSTEKAATMLSWRPTFTTEQGLTRTIDWYESFFKERDNALRYPPSTTG